jgi:hypothetical protein
MTHDRQSLPFLLQSVHWHLYSTAMMPTSACIGHCNMYIYVLGTISMYMIYMYNHPCNNDKLINNSDTCMYIYIWVLISMKQRNAQVGEQFKRSLHACVFGCDLCFVSGCDLCQKDADSCPPIRLSQIIFSVPYIYACQITREDFWPLTQLCNRERRRV